MSLPSVTRKYWVGWVGEKDYRAVLHGGLRAMLEKQIVRTGRTVTPNKALQLTANPLRGLSAAELGR